MGKRELVALLNLSSWCLVMVERLFLAVPRVCLRFVIVIFPDHTHLLYFIPNFVCVLTNERYKTYRTGFSFCHIGHAPGWDFGAPEVPRGINLFQTCSCDISNRQG